MARKNQKLINYHTGSKTAMPSGSSVDFGEIVVRHNAETPELLIKIGTDSFGVFQASGAVKTAIDSAVSAAQSTLNTTISGLQSDVKSLSSATKTLIDEVSGATKATYATKEELKSTSGSIISDYTTAIGDAKDKVYTSATTFATNAVNTAKADLKGSIDSLEASLTGHVADFEQFQTTVETTYATKEELKSTSGSIITAIGAAKKEVYDSATTFATSAVTVAKGELNTSISNVANDLKALSGVVSSITTNIEENYVTTGDLNTKVEELEGKISSAKTEAIGKASGYTDTQIAAAKEYSDGKLSAATETLNQSITAVSGSVSTLSANVHTRIESLESGLTDTINKKVAVAYRYQGTKTNYEDLPTSEMSKDTIGFVYNVENAHGNYPAGTNYAWNGKEWDALGGSVDLSPYALKTEVSASADTLNKSIEAVSASLDTFKTTVASTYATKDELKSTSGSIITAYTNAIADAKLEAIGTASGYTDTQVSAAKDSVYSSATTAAATDATTKANKAKEDAIAAAAASANTLQNNINTVNNSVTGLSASTVNIQGIANTAIQTASIVDSATCKVSVEKEGTELQFNFRNLVIDCGDF